MGGRACRHTQRLPYLDGVRAVAVAMVLAYHGGVPGLSRGGFYGVDVFFVLSGFLITSLLVGQEASGGVRFAAFWARRARRLLPALVVMLAAVDLYVAYLAPAGRYPGFRGDALSVLFYVSNWHFIAVSSNYFASASPSLLTHTWSLAIEEQFYLVWPLVVWATARAARRAGRIGPAGAVAAVAGAGAVLSAAWMAVGYRAGQPASRLYFGTDTHASSLLVGAALGAAMTAAAGRRRAPTGPARRARLATPMAVGALAALGWAACSVGSSNGLAYQGGFLGVAAVTAVLLGALTVHPGGAAARVLSVRPVAYAGRISYGMYLWYFPLFALVDHSSTGLSGAALLALRVAADVGVAAASHHLIETRFLHRLPPGPLPGFPGRRPVVAVAAGAAAVVGLVALTAPAGMSGPGPGPGPGRLALAGATTAAGPSGSQLAGAAPLRLLVIGDSTGLTLGLALGFPAVEQRYGLVVDDAAVMGCGLAVSARVEDHGRRIPAPAACNASSPAADLWPARLRSQIATFHPDVVLVASGRWELDSSQPRPGGRWTDISQPADRAYVSGQLQLAASIARAGGARLALATAPCFSSGETPGGSPWPEDGRRRLDAYNGVVRSVAAGQPGATVVDLEALVCPGGRFRTVIGGVTVRAPDGIHYPFFDIAQPAAAAPDTEAQAQRFGLWVAPRILAALRTRPVASG
ncbi:MAG TPA: acyltransferase family protein [Acidimicrobiales bacterium]|nr:acyltransferase family protein [Acidimicrobiales bacterium]